MQENMYRENVLPPFFPSHFIVLFKKTHWKKRREKKMRRKNEVRENMYRENFLPPFFPPHFLVLFKKTHWKKRREKKVRRKK